MQRTELMKSLKVVSPALASNTIVPILSHFWFDGDYVMAYNDIISIRVPLRADFVGAIPGKTIMELLSKSKARKIEFQHLNNELLIKAASSRIKLGVLPETDFLFEFPSSEDGGNKIKCTSDLLRSIRICLMSTGLDASVPEQLGITCRIEDNRLVFYSTNGATLSCSKLKVKNLPVFNRNVILPTDFCKQMLLFADDKSRLVISDDFALLDAGKVQVFGKLIESENPLNFSSVINEHVGSNIARKLVQIPTKLKLILERAAVVTDVHGDQKATRIRVQDEVANFLSESDRGQVRDRMQLKGHPDTRTLVEPSLVKSGYGHFDHICFTEPCVVMSQKSSDSESFYLVAARQ